MKQVIHIYGASGSGTSTLGKAISRGLGYHWMDTDDFFWMPTEPKFTTKRPISERIQLMKEEIGESENVVISGSLVDWGDELIPLFTLAIRLVTPTQVRIDRIKKREYERFGNRIQLGGDMYQQHQAFIEWATAYDTGDERMRSKANHDKWEKLLTCQQMVLDGSADLGENLKQVEKVLFEIEKTYAPAFNAEEYDKMIKRTLPFYETFYDEIIQVVKVQWHKPVNWLDIGCGTGKMAEVAFRQIPIEKFVFCDPSSEMLAIAKSRFDQASCIFTEASIEQLKVNQAFEVITAIQVFHYLQESERIGAIQKAYEALADGGIMISFENFAPSSQLGKKLYLERWKRYQISQGKSEEEAELHISRYGKGYFPISIEKHLEVFRIVGFKAVEVFWVSNMQVGVLGIK